MKNKQKYALSLVIIILTLSGCFPNQPSITQTSLPSVLPSSTPEIPAAVVFTTTQLPNITPPPTRVLPPLLTPRVTPFPTITDASEELEILLQTNGNCELPCFWGIFPEQTRYEELYSVIDKLEGSRFEELLENGHIRVSSDFTYEKKHTIRVALAADLQSDVVKDLEVTILNQLDTGVNSEDWSAYNIDNILDNYGVPDTVEIYFGTPYDALTFGIRLKYENIHTSIMYSGRTTETNKYLTLTPPSAIFCPEEIGIYAVVLHIGRNPFNDEPDGVPLSEATGMDEQAFYKLFTENPSACLTLNRDAMP